jgi:outer membrane protein assembly factor BamB
MYVCGNDYVRAIDVYGSVKWKQSVGSCSQTTPAINFDGSIYVTSSDNYLYHISEIGSIEWSFQTGNSIYSSPTIGNDGTIYFASTDMNLYAVHPTGSVVWSFYIESSSEASPAIDDDGSIYIGTVGGVFYSINPNGLPNWAIQTVYGQLDKSSPSISEDGTIYVGSTSSNHVLYAFSSLGSINWQFIADGPIYCSPSIAPNSDIVIYSYSNYYEKTFVYYLSSAGSLIWKYPLTSGSTLSTSPVIGSDGMIYIAIESLYALFPTGSLVWKTLIDDGPQTPTISSDGIIYTGAGSIIWAIGTTISTLFPSSISPKGLQICPSPKFKGNSMNTVFCILNIYSIL